MTKSHICEAACHIRDNEYKDIRQSDFASLLTMSTLISLSSWGPAVAGPLFLFREISFFINEVLLIDEVVASIALAILLQKLDDVLSILANMLFVSIISVDENHQVGSVAIHLGSLIVTGWSSHTTDIVSVNRQAFDVDYASADALVWFACLAHT